MADKKSREVDFIVDENGIAEDVRGKDALTVKIDVDVAEALTGLKAVQREAKKATAALRELAAAGVDFDADYNEVMTQLLTVPGICEHLEAVRKTRHAD